MNRASMTSEKSQTKDKNPGVLVIANEIAGIFCLKIPAKVGQAHWLFKKSKQNRVKNM